MKKYEEVYDEFIRQLRTKEVYDYDNEEMQEVYRVIDIQTALIQALDEVDFVEDKA
jgi:hypothetical protein